MFEKRILDAKAEVIEEKEKYPAMLTYYSGRAKNLQMKVAKLVRIRELIKRADWMPFCNISDLICEKYDSLVMSINDIIKTLYKKWINYIGENPHERLNCFLMKRKSEEMNFKLECNMDSLILDLCRDVNNWLDWDFLIPFNIQIVFEKSDTLLFVYEKVVSIVLSYNKILDGNFFYT